MDRIPVIAIDPKGDLGDLLLTFPNLKPADFEPWVNSQEAEAKGMTRQQFAEEQASTWEKGLADWGQSGERIKRLREAADFAIYTPGSTAGAPISVLRAFTAPPEAIRNDADLFRERLQTTASSVLGAARHRRRPDHEPRAHPRLEHPAALVDCGQGPRPARADRPDPEPAVREDRCDGGGPGLSGEGAHGAGDADQQPPRGAGVRGLDGRASRSMRRSCSTPTRGSRASRCFRSRTWAMRSGCSSCPCCSTT